MKKPLKTAAWSSIILCCVAILYMFIYMPLSIISPNSSAIFFVNIIYYIIALALAILIWNGLIFLGEYFENRLLTVASWSMLIFSMFGTLSSIFLQVYLLLQGAGPRDLFKIIGLGYFLIFLLVSLLVSIILYLLLGIGLTKLGDKVELAKTTGILYIIAAATLIIIIGFFIIIPALIFTIIMLFKAANKLEGKPLKAK